MNVSELISIEQIKSSLEFIRFPLQLDNVTEITGFNITTVCTPFGDKYYCMCEDQYFWPHYNCIHAECDPLKEGFSSDGGMCVPMNVNHVIRFSMKINTDFDTALIIKTSISFTILKEKLENSIDESYRMLPEYEANSAKVHDFRPGSVIADFSINSTSRNLNLSSANQQLVNNLRTKGFNISNDAFTLSVSNELYKSEDQIYPGQNMTLTCNKTVNNTIKWMRNGVKLKESKKFMMNANNLTVTNITPEDSEFTCSDDVFGVGNVDDVHDGDCDRHMVGYQKAKCDLAGHWEIIETSCIIRVIQILKDKSEVLLPTELPQFVANLSIATKTNSPNITNSPSNILAIAAILKNTANTSQTILVSKPVMTDFLETVDVIVSKDAQKAWMDINQNLTTSNASSEFLETIERISRRLPNEKIEIKTKSAHLKRINITVPFLEKFNNNLTNISIPMIIEPSPITIIVFSTLDIVLPVRTAYNSSSTNTRINGDVAVIEPTPTINNISFSFAVKNKTMGNPQCVFWNFKLQNHFGGWDSTGCQLKKSSKETGIFTCECNHTTSFSILMSPFSEVNNEILDYITYIGVGISMGSLVLCLIIEFIIWKSVTRNDTSYMRHVSIVNVAFCLLIANICFIIGAAVIKNGVGPCSTATFFMHFFYLALFFWMLLSALLLLYRTLMVFSRMSRGAMISIGFTVGYGAPLLIAVITVALTAGNNEYIQQGYNCWLNWNKTKALLAFVIPALTIVAINLLVLIVVLCKMLRRRVNVFTQPDDKHPLQVIVKCVGILTPLFGLTWGFGIGTMVSSKFGIHVVFAFLNSLQVCDLEL
ncbi:Adhesion G protein-coupled receptor F5 [Bagarius yarrelli]|uniref:Adhesion G protein-coupled receptor F5 n=1 Tax=Bagarius yarrelli TaxID=175774 RepID=A0A556U2S1_BAGYA|nr:Adhesion G protein-coupled receptor F5 [Bagarius yarrelli]